jgi:NADPH:quinone reductase-like Zn-dependent oxidoreductase
MKVYEIRESFGLDNLVQTERPDPSPGPGQVVVKVKATSINYRDVLMVKGHYNPRQPLPLIPLSDGVGEIIAVGDGVTRVGVGDRVVGCFLQGLISRPGDRAGAYLRTTLGGPLDGMLAEQVLLSAEGVSKVPDYLSDAQAATLPCAPLTAWSALVAQGNLRPGDTVVVQGTGGVSMAALQIAAAIGAEVIVTSSSDEKLERARTLGAHHAINYKTHPEWGKVVKKITDRVGVDHVVEVGGAGTLAQSLRAVRPGGQVSIIGVLAGGKGEVNLTPVLMRNIRLQGVLVGSRDELEAMCRFFALEELEPIVDRVFPFDQAREALEHVAAGKHFGKVCISIP